MIVGRYNAKDTTVLINGIAITGFGEDMISWEKEEPYFEPKVGAQGDVLKSEINNNLHTLTITVQPTSPQFRYLIGLQGQSENITAWCINKKLGVRFGGTTASVSEAPEIALGAEADDCAFAITVFDGVTETLE